MARKMSQAQSVIEYVLIFCAVAAGVILAVGAFGPEKLGEKFEEPVNNLLDDIRTGKLKPDGQNPDLRTDAVYLPKMGHR